MNEWAGKTKFIVKKVAETTAAEKTSLSSLQSIYLMMMMMKKRSLTWFFVINPSWESFMCTNGAKKNTDKFLELAKNSMRINVVPCCFFFIEWSNALTHHADNKTSWKTHGWKWNDVLPVHEVHVYFFFAYNIFFASSVVDVICDPSK